MQHFADRGPRSHQGAVRCRACTALRHLGAGGAGRDCKPAHDCDWDVEKPGLEAIARRERAPPDAARTGSRKAYFAAAGGFVDTPTFARPALLAGNRIEGPALIEEHASTTVVLPGDSVEVDAIGNLVITVSGTRQ